MRKLFLFTVVAVMALAPMAMAQLPQKVIGAGLGSGRTGETHQTFDRVLSCDTVYVLTGIYYVDSTYSMTIEPGTVVLGDTAATLIVARGGQLFSMGEPWSPVVFTSLKAPGNRAPGDWGGLVLLGNGSTNKGQQVLEGGIGGAIYGSGSTANDPGSQGIIKYTRVEFPGYRFALNDEINSITFGGVQEDTEFHHVQCSYGFDDQYEWFGGRLDAKYLIAFGGTDDCFDTDFGMRGRLQHLFALRDPDFWDPTGESRGFESDNDGSGSSDTPLTAPIFSNVTMVGPERTDAHIPHAGSFDWSAVVRRNSRLAFFNSVIMGWGGGVSIRDGSRNNLTWENISIQASGSSPIPSVTEAGCSYMPSTVTVHNTSRWLCSDGVPGTYEGVLDWFDNGVVNSIGSSPRLPSTVAISDLSNLNDPDPRPTLASELVTPGNWDYTNPLVDDGWFDKPSYRGAFPSVNTAKEALWYREFANFDPQNTDYSNGAKGFASDVGDRAPSTNVTLDNYPNPFNPSTTIRFSVPTAGQVTIDVFNVRGQKVAQVLSRQMKAGDYEEPFIANDLATGTYFFRITGPGFTKTSKMVLLK
jgi:hypothetical protein